MNQDLTRFASRVVPGLLMITVIYSASSRPAVAQDVLQAVINGDAGFETAAPNLFATAPGHGIQLVNEVLTVNRFGEVPHIPEPMVFDLVRELGSDQGEFEANVLSLYPLNSTIVSPDGDPFSPAPDSPDEGEVEWAPEVEYDILDGVGLEFELPFEGSELEAYKVAGQFTFGTAFDAHFIHGTQVIVEPYVDFDVWDLTFLYLAGVRFNKTWSMMSMVGFRSAAGEEDAAKRTEKLFNLAVFADVCEDVVLGVESNYANRLDGRSAMLVMPQLHVELCEHVALQAGVGVGFTDEHSLPIASMRAIYER